MKWKCKNCHHGPCMFEKDGLYLFTGNCPVATLLKTDWKPMSGEEPEQEAGTGLPKWLKVGNFIKIGEAKEAFRIDGYDRSTDTFAVSYINRYGYIGESEDFHIQDFSDVRQVFPKPYTLETAPHFIKAKRKIDDDITLLELSRTRFSTEYLFWSYLDWDVISFEKALRDYEQLDGWPCGTFDEGE